MKIGQTIPSFNVDALMPNGSFDKISPKNFDNRYLVLFFYPLDFTFVCPTEILEFSERAKDFAAINCDVVGCSIDSLFSHFAWTQLDRKAGGLGKVNIPLIADLDKSLSQTFGCLMDTGFTNRALFIIDPEKKIRQITMNDPGVGRNVAEVQAIQFFDKHGEVCPVNWQPGQKTIIQDPIKKLQFFNQ